MALIYAIGASEWITFVFISSLSLVLWGTSAFLFAIVAGADDKLTAGLAICIFLADSKISYYFFNGLETGLYLLCLLALARSWGRFTRTTISSALLLGGLLV